jgi:oligoendopeptidase F
VSVSLPDWLVFEPEFDALLAFDLDAAGVPGWLERWSDLESRLLELSAQVNRDYAQNSLDLGAEARFHCLIDRVVPPWKIADHALKQKLLAVSDFVPDAGTEQFVRQIRNSVEVFRPENVPLEAELDRLQTEYGKIVGALMVRLDGQDLTLPQVHQRLLELDRDRRESAWRAVHAAMLSVRDELSVLFLKILPLRRALAKNAGLANFRDLAWRTKHRFDYSPADCLELHSSVLEAVVPLALSLGLERQVSLGLESVRPWDTVVDPLVEEPLKPFASVVELEDRVEGMLGLLDPKFGIQFSGLRNGFLDLESRKGKRPGGFCDFFPVSRRAYIFMNAVGTHDDVQTMLHEAGHAFHAIESAEANRLVWNFHGPMEFCEVASMGMEMLAQPYLERQRGGFYSDADAERARREHLQGVVDFLPYMCVVDAFQQWLYSDAPADLTARDLDAKWDELYCSFRPGEDWTGLEEIRATGWQRKIHVFAYPLYYIEYGIAQLGALQLWRNGLKDEAGTVVRYRQALRCGQTRGLRELFGIAGIELAFDVQTVAGLMELVAARLGSNTAV